MDKRCLLCYNRYDGEGDYHPECYRKSCIAGIDPVIPYSIDQMHELATKVVGERITVPGVQPKISLGTYNRIGGKKITIIDYPGSFILKPQSVRYLHLPENEDCTMKLAELSGIQTVPHALVRLKSGEPAYISARIDRGEEKKIHMEDMCQVSGRLTEDKYKSSAENIARLIYRYSENMLFDVIRFFERVLFCFITGNADMHLKNYSFIYYNDTPHLSPAYDLLNTKIVVPEDNEESALTINGKKNRIKLQDFNKLGESCSIPVKTISYIYDKYCHPAGKMTRCRQ